MLPGMGGMNPKKMQAMMKQLGIKQEDIEASRVIVEKEEGNIVIDNPQVSKVIMGGQETWQIIGDAHEEEASDIVTREDDVKLVMEKTGKSEEKVRNVLEETGDIAEAIVKLSE
jgi:nascent polypeptide-associated complex subunit alpha